MLIKAPSAMEIIAQVVAEAAKASRRGQHVSDVFMGPSGDHGAYHAQLTFKDGEKRVA